MPLTSITDVIHALDKIVLHCIATKNRAGYFAALYKHMTMAVGEGILNGRFEDGKRMEQLDIVFAQRYLNAWELYYKPALCTVSWKGSFDSCSNKSLIVMQHLLLGINTHINLDLAIAAATVSPGNKIHAMANDFNRINDVIASLLDDVQQCLEQVWLPMRWLKRVAAKEQHDVLNFSIGVARKTAWANAVLLAGMTVQQQQAHIQAMDRMVHNVGRRIISPGMWSSAVLKMIRMTEYEDVARTIRLIDTTVVE